MTQDIQTYINDLKSFFDRENISKQEIFELINSFENKPLKRNEVHKLLIELKNTKILKKISLLNLQESWLNFIIKLI